MKHFITTLLLCSTCLVSCGDDEGQQTQSTSYNFTAREVDSGIEFSWDAHSKAESYTLEVHQNGSIRSQYNNIHDTYTILYSNALSKNTTYTFKVYADLGNYSTQLGSIQMLYSGSGGNTGGGSTTLSVPTGVSASQSGSSVSISWNAVAGASSYFVYRSGSATGNYSSLTSVSGTSATDASPLSGYNYYKIKASNGSATSDYSSYAYVNYSGGNTGGGGNQTTKPSAPTGVTAENVGSALIPEVRVSWNSVSNATSYKVYRSTSANGTYSQIGSATTSTRLSDTSPRSGQNYYKVKAVNSAGESGYSSYASYNNDPSSSVSPCPVTYGNCTVSGSTITMRWTVPTTFGCGTPTKAHLRVRNASTGEYETVQTLSGTATSATFSFNLKWIGSGQFDNGYVYIGVITENAKGTSGGVPKVYDTINKRWVI